MATWLIGGGGFLGSELTRTLVTTGRDVVVLGRNAAPVNPVPREARYIVGDYADPSILARVAATADEVVHLAYATVPQASFADPVADIILNLPPTVRLLRALARERLSRFVLVSSGGTVYGPTETSPIAETEPTNPISPYGITKLALEKYSRMFAAMSEFPVVIVRPANAYGDRQTGRDQGFIAAAMRSLINGHAVVIYGEKGTVRDYVHVSDVGAGIAAALAYGEVGEIYNIGTGIGRDNFEVLREIEPLARNSGLQISIQLEPPRPFDVPSNVLDSTKLRVVSGWAPQVAFSDGIRSSWAAVLASSR